MRSIEAIIIHCAATPSDMDIGVDTIRRWHVDERGFDDVGYHYVIRRDGTVERGRPEETPGAHVAGHNSRTLGICLVGGQGKDGKPDCNYTADQWAELEDLVEHLKAAYPDAKIAGHRDYDSGKACPTFDVAAWWNGREAA